jgi:quercetin dioxygenase-like cupin family protein
MTTRTTPSQSPRWPWSPGLDALVAAPLHHNLLFENSQVRVLDTKVPPGDTVPLHTHQWPSVLHVLSWSDCVRRDANGKVDFDTRSETPAVLQQAVTWCEPLPPHSLENVGTKELHILMIEIKQAKALESQNMV